MARVLRADRSGLHPAAGHQLHRLGQLRDGGDGLDAPADWGGVRVNTYTTTYNKLTKKEQTRGEMRVRDILSLRDTAVRTLVAL